jgi:hypothetical protein
MQKDTFEKLEKFINSNDQLSGNYVVIDILKFYFEDFKNSKTSKTIMDKHFVGTIKDTEVYLDPESLYSNLSLVSMTSEEYLEIDKLMTQKELNNLLNNENFIS